MECFIFSAGLVLKKEEGCVRVSVCVCVCVNMCVCVCVCVGLFTPPLSPLSHEILQHFSDGGGGKGGAGDVTQRCLRLTVKRKYTVI